MRYEVVLPPINQMALETAVIVEGVLLDIDGHGYLRIENSEEEDVAIFREWLYVTEKPEEDET